MKLRKCPSCKLWRFTRTGYWCSKGDRISYPSSEQWEVTKYRLTCPDYKSKKKPRKKHIAKPASAKEILKKLRIQGEVLRQCRATAKILKDQKKRGNI